MNYEGSPFGAELGLAPRWSGAQAWYQKCIGVVDLPSRLRARRVIEALPKNKAGRVLDYGCGNGAYVFYLSRNPGTSVAGFDVNTARVDRCLAVNDRLGRANVHLVNGTEEAFWGRQNPDSFDLILAVEVLAYVNDLGTTLRRMYEHLRPGGRLIGHLELEGRTGSWDRRVFEPPGVREALAQAGFEAVETGYSFAPLHRRLFTWLDVFRAHPRMTGALFPFALAAAFAVDRFLERDAGLVFHATRPVAD